MHANAPIHPALAGKPGIALRHQLLQRDGALHGADHRAEFGQHAVAGGLDDPPAVLGDQRIGGGAMLAQCLRGARLVHPHQPAVADDIGSKDRGELTGCGHSSGNPALRRPSA